MAMPPKQKLTSKSEGCLVNANLSIERRNKLTSLRQREELKDALTDKFKGRFGSGGAERGFDERSVASSVIKREVDRFADGGANATDGNLGRLERRLEGQAKKSGSALGSSLSANAPTNISAYSGIGGGQRSRSLVSVGSNVAESSLCSQAFDWARMDEYAALLHEHDAIRQKHGVHALQKKLKSELDHQVREKESKKVAADEEERRYHHNSMAEVERWKQTEQMRAEECHQKLQREKHDRDEQLAYERKLKDAEVQRKKVEETSLVEKIVHDMEAEQHKMHRKKEEQKKSMRRVFEENKKEDAKREVQNMKAAEKELNAMKEYNRILDEQEKNRAEELASRMTRQKELMEKLQSNVAQQAKSAGDNDAQRAAAQQAEMDKHYFEAEKTKINRLKQIRHENQAYILKQMSEKDGRGSEEKEMCNIQARILERDTAEYEQVEREKAINTRNRNFAHRQEVERQIEVKAGVRAVLMSDAERQINKPLVRLVHRSLKARDNPP